MLHLNAANGSNLEISTDSSNVSGFHQEDNELFYLTKPYNEIESRDFDLKGQKVKLYPTESVKKIFSDEINKTQEQFNEKIIDLFAKSKLTIPQDTILYPNKKFLNNKKIVIKKNNIHNKNKELKSKIYMFVLTNKDHLLASTKQSCTENGRIHHSSLSRGKPVRAAGMMKIEENGDGTKTIILTNDSGHYKPSRQSIDRVINWLKDHSLRFDITVDESKLTDYGRLMRTVVLKTS